MRRVLLIGALVVATALPAAATSSTPAPGPWSATPVAGNAMGHSLTFMLRVSDDQGITEVNMDYEGDVVTCTFRNATSGDWLVGEHLVHLRRPIARGSRRFSVAMHGEALNQGGLPGATVHYALTITGRFVSPHSARGTIHFREGCKVPSAYAPWRALG